MSGLVENLLDLIYPPRCMFCHRMIRHGRICDSCSGGLPLLGPWERRQSFEGIDSCSSLFYYENDVRESLRRYKFHGLSFYGEEYARLMLLHFTLEETACDVVSWVPLSRKRLRSRGYDQARLIASQLAAYLGVPCERVLDKVKNVAPQSLTGAAAERRANIAQAYRVHPGAEIRGRTILLIDDIVTTGSTISECARTLRAHGAAGVKALTVARRKD